MFDFRARPSLHAVKPLLAVALIGAGLVLPSVAEAAIFASAPSDNGASLTFKTTSGTMTGKWAYRSIAITGDPKASFAKMALGGSEFDLVEEGGKITGTRPGPAKGKPYPVTGFVVYGSRKAPQVVLHSTSDVGGKSYEYDYFGYLMPNWNVGAAQPDTFMGTVVRTDPSGGAAVVVSFIATREPAGGSRPAASPLPANSSTPKPAATEAPAPAK